MIMANIDWSKMVTVDAKAAEVLAAKHAAVNTERERKTAAGAMVAHRHWRHPRAGVRSPCADCGTPLTACWSKSRTGAKHPYFHCPKRGCENYGKSIRLDKIEGEFEALLQSVQPNE